VVTFVGMGEGASFRSADLEALYDRARVADVERWRDMEAAFEAAVTRGDAPVPPVHECVTLVLRLVEAGDGDAASTLAGALAGWIAAGEGRSPGGMLSKTWLVAQDLAALGSLPRGLHAVLARAALDGDVAGAFAAVREHCSALGKEDRLALLELFEERAPRLVDTFAEAMGAPATRRGPKTLAGRMMSSPEFYLALGAVAIILLASIGEPQRPVPVPGEPPGHESWRTPAPPRLETPRDRAGKACVALADEASVRSMEDLVQTTLQLCDVLDDCPVARRRRAALDEALPASVREQKDPIEGATRELDRELDVLCPR
jgi:hypothetical protein